MPSKAIARNKVSNNPNEKNACPPKMREKNERMKLKSLPDSSEYHKSLKGN